MAISFQIEAQLSLKNCVVTPDSPFGFGILVALAKILLFPHSHKPRKNLCISKQIP